MIHAIGVVYHNTATRTAIEHKIGIEEPQLSIDTHEQYFITFDRLGKA